MGNQFQKYKQKQPSNKINDMIVFSQRKEDNILEIQSFQKDGNRGRQDNSHHGHHSLTNSRQTSKHKRYLSLSKNNPPIHSAIKKTTFNGSNTNDSRQPSNQIFKTSQQKTSLGQNIYSKDNYSKQLNYMLKQKPIKPKDLPKSIAKQSITTTKKNHLPNRNHLNPPQLQKRVIINRPLPQNHFFCPPQISVNNIPYNAVEHMVKPMIIQPIFRKVEIKKKSYPEFKYSTCPSNEINLKESIVTPFPFQHYDNEVNIKSQSRQLGKLKKITSVRNICTSIENNQKSNAAHNSNEFKRLSECKTASQVQTNHESSPEDFVFTNPQLYTYITNKEHPFINNSNHKYAIPVSCLNIPLQNRILDRQPITESKVHKYATSNPFISAQSIESMISKQTESKPLIQFQQQFHFPTITEFSESQKSQSNSNSFVPIIKNNELYSRHKQQPTSQLDEQQYILSYCRPNIDSKILADINEMHYFNK